ncbi:glycoside hydrolase domain-containing protein [Chondrinema litorale]|uniref:glycoside hydrolase domain-containing protein n=1 Tax=Chondrinema litorale TaxID=2994555 RepID=UPI002542724F|nr:glycoside hydrolase domain-containing protein [Chondrinema litorale]UZR99883.1 glycoside hydrolase family 92 protein [Chondrinema litorale]
MKTLLPCTLKLKVFILLIAGVNFVSCTNHENAEATHPDEDVTRYVNPNLGPIDGKWFFYSPAALPFGMAKLSPYTNSLGNVGSSLPAGYDDTHTSIEGFGHMHEFQIGGLLIMPTTGKIVTSPGSLKIPDAGYRSRFEKREEIATTGYYAVKLKDYDIEAELTATKNVGLHRYTFPASSDSHILFDIGRKQGERNSMIDASAKMISDTELEGCIETYPDYNQLHDPEKHVKMFFAARLSKAPKEVGSFNKTGYTSGNTQTDKTENGLIFTFSTVKNEEIEMQVSLSFTSTESAWLNMQKETAHINFDQARENARAAWQNVLSRVQVSGGTKEDKVKFYTGLYHAVLGRGIKDQLNGQNLINYKGTMQFSSEEMTSSELKKEKMVPQT